MVNQFVSTELTNEMVKCIQSRCVPLFSDDGKTYGSSTLVTLQDRIFLATAGHLIEKHNHFQTCFHVKYAGNGLRMIDLEPINVKSHPHLDLGFIEISNQTLVKINGICCDKNEFQNDLGTECDYFLAGFPLSADIYENTKSVVDSSNFRKHTRRNIPITCKFLGAKQASTCGRYTGNTLEFEMLLNFKCSEFPNDIDPAATSGGGFWTMLFRQTGIFNPANDLKFIGIQSSAIRKLPVKLFGFSSMDWLDYVIKELGLSI